MPLRIKKRKKATRHRGSHTHGRGAMKKARGKGHTGGKGLSGSGKRADQKKTLVLKIDKKYFGKSKKLRRKKPKKLEAINIQKILDNLPTYTAIKQANETKDGIVINLKGYKILSGTDSDLKKKLKITASSASKTAEEKVKKAGGEIIVEK